jgi:peptidyl-prolyl cis-trans isomerase B (cyclophilin B)
MQVIRKLLACAKLRTVLAAAEVVAAASFVLTPVSAAPGEEPGYRQLVELESTRSFSGELSAALVSRDVRLAGRAALALGRTGDSRAAVLLRNATTVEEVPLRALAIYGYGLLAAKAGNSTSVVARALRDIAPPVRLAAVDAAWRQEAAQVRGAEEFSAALLTMLRHEPDNNVRARAAAALFAWNVSRNANTIAAHLASAFVVEQNADVRWHEAWTLRRGYARFTSDALVKAGLADRDELVRIQFADLIARRGHPHDNLLLDPLLTDPSWRVQEQAFESGKVLAAGTRTEHLTTIPEGIVTPSPAPDATDVPLPRPAALGPPRKPLAADARLDLALRPTTSALMSGPMPGAHPRVRIGTTKGAIVVRLFPEWAPMTVANFLNLVDRGYYDGLRWFRIVPDFVVQTGDPKDTGDGDAGYSIPAEENPLEQRAGVISMGLNYSGGLSPAPLRDSAGTQFYITLSPQLHLDRDFTVFGEVEKGFANLGRLVESDRITRVERISDD